MARLIHGDCLEVLKTLDEASVDAVVTDPPLIVGASHFDFGLESNHPRPIAWAMPAASFFLLDPEENRFSPNGVIPRFPGTKRESIKDFDQLQAGGFGLDYPDDARLTVTISATVFLDMTDASNGNDFLKDRGIIVSQFQGKLTGVISA